MSGPNARRTTELCDHDDCYCHDYAVLTSAASSGDLGVVKWTVYVLLAEHGGNAACSNDMRIGALWTAAERGMFTCWTGLSAWPDSIWPSMPNPWPQQPHNAADSMCSGGWYTRRADPFEWEKGQARTTRSNQRTTAWRPSSNIRPVIRLSGPGGLSTRAFGRARL